MKKEHRLQLETCLAKRERFFMRLCQTIVLVGALVLIAFVAAGCIPQGGGGTPPKDDLCNGSGPTCSGPPPVCDPNRLPQCRGIV